MLEAQFTVVSSTLLTTWALFDLLIIFYHEWNAFRTILFIAHTLFNLMCFFKWYIKELNQLLRQNMSLVRVFKKIVQTFH